jgi:uncharacterized protein (TIGR02246 family)
MLRNLTILLVCVVVTACATSPRASENTRIEVEQASDRFWAERDRADAAGFAAQFTEEGMLMISGLADAEGREAIRELMQKRFASTRITDFKVLRREIDVAGDAVWELGWFSEIVRSDNPMRMSGRYLIVWKRGGDDVWRAHRYVYSYSGAKPVA